MPRFHRIRIQQSKGNINELQKPKPNKYTQKDFHKSHSINKSILKHKT